MVMAALDQNTSAATKSHRNRKGPATTNLQDSCRHSVLLDKAAPWHCF